MYNIHTEDDDIDFGGFAMSEQIFLDVFHDIPPSICHLGWTLLDSQNKGRIDGLQVMAGLIMYATARLRDKIEELLKLVDFQEQGKLSKFEVIILFKACTQAASTMSSNVEQLSSEEIVKIVDEIWTTAANAPSLLYGRPVQAAPGTSLEPKRNTSQPTKPAQPIDDGKETVHPAAKQLDTGNADTDAADTRLQAVDAELLPFAWLVSAAAENTFVVENLTRNGTTDKDQYVTKKQGMRLC